MSGDWPAPAFSFGQRVRGTDWGEDDNAVMVVGMRYCQYAHGCFWIYIVAEDATAQASLYRDEYDEFQLVAA